MRSLLYLLYVGKMEPMKDSKCNKGTEDNLLTLLCMFLFSVHFSLS